MRREYRVASTSPLMCCTPRTAPSTRTRYGSCSSARSTYWPSCSRAPFRLIRQTVPVSGATTSAGHILLSLPTLAAGMHRRRGRSGSLCARSHLSPAGATRRLGGAARRNGGCLPRAVPLRRSRRRHRRTTGPYGHRRFVVRVILEGTSGYAAGLRTLRGHRLVRDHDAEHRGDLARPGETRSGDVPNACSGAAGVDAG